MCKLKYVSNITFLQCHKNLSFTETQYSKLTQMLNLLKYFTSLSISFFMTIYINDPHKYTEYC
jgi:hypothetical protein